LFAERAEAKTKHDSWAIPSKRKPLQDAGVMKKVPALRFNTRCLPDSLHETDVAIIVDLYI
jgi:hypothetical protein